MGCCGNKESKNKISNKWFGVFWVLTIVIAIAIGNFLQ
jgi:hypothetical protein